MRLLFLALIIPSVAAAQGTGHVGMLRRAYVDSTRSNWEKTGPRPLSTVIFYPIADSIAEDSARIGPPERPLFVAGTVKIKAPLLSGSSRFPLVVLSHGTGGSGWQMGWLGIALARHGYIVAAVDHHGNTGAEERYDPRGFVLWWERTRDLHRVLDRLMVDTLFGPRLDTTRIGAAGFSLGGYTVTALAGGRTDLDRFSRFCSSPAQDATCGGQPEFPEAPALLDGLSKKDPAISASLLHAGDDYRDPRVTAAVALAPAVVQAFDSASLRAIPIPMLIIVGGSDESAPGATNANPLAALVPRGSLVTLEQGVGHYDFLSECSRWGRAQLPLLCGERAGVKRRNVHWEVSERVHDFFGKQWGAR